MREKLTIAYGRSTWNGEADYCAMDAREMLWIVQDANSAQIIICERAFVPPRLSLDQIPCNLIGNRASTTTMEVIGSHIFHELVHWKALIDIKLGFHIGDWDPGGDEGGDDQLQDSYDPYNAWQLNVRGKSPALNAENCLWYATESYWAVRCSRLTSFDDPLPEQKL